MIKKVILFSLAIIILLFSCKSFIEYRNDNKMNKKDQYNKLSIFGFEICKKKDNK